jgi:hypothetical protein
MRGEIFVATLLVGVAAVAVAAHVPQALQQSTRRARRWRSWKRGPTAGSITS